MARKKKAKKDIKKVTGFSLTPEQIKRIAVLSKNGNVSRSSLVGNWADMIWTKSKGAKVKRKTSTKKKVKKSQTGGKRLKR